ncbi:MHS family MFS transporter [Streptomyces sp. KM273126]|uniref:MFS transporter n=1 Tax=Streptomyces sp. KM273126 TaxID=2545247 RepID=UPI00103CDEE2|nr:MFS transporter [Streptomyces sp. KM273126]MBA2813887.1 MHS family MFS transporter [Streptomyces sp. KM273126]
MTSITTPPAPDARVIRKVALASTVGSIIEWYDFALFGVAAGVVFNKLFFPADDPLVGTMLAFAVNAVAFFIRPVGGVIFGHFGDRIGRRKVLAITLVIMGASTTLIGLLPTYEQIGVAAPVLLILVRCLQGLGAGAEFSGAVIMVAEYAPEKKRGLYTSLPNTGVAVGLLLATGLFTLVLQLPEAALLSWGWRIPFLISAVGVGIGLYIRLRLDETPEFAALQEKEDKPRRMPAMQLLQTQGRAVVVGILACFAESSTSYLAKTFVLAYVADQLGLSEQIGLTAVMVASAVSIATIPLFGHLGDRFGRRRVYLVGTVFVGLFVAPFFLLLNTKSSMLIVLAVVGLYALGVRAMSGTQGAYLSEMFKPDVRFSGVAFAREISSPLAGGVAPLIATALLAATGTWWSVAAYIAAMSVISAVAVIIGPGTPKPARPQAPEVVVEQAATATGA